MTLDIKPLVVASAVIGSLYTITAIMTGASSDNTALLDECQKIITICCNNLTNPLTPECTATLDEFRFMADPDLMRSICPREISIMMRIASSSTKLYTAAAYGIVGAITLIPSIAYGVHTWRSYRKAKEQSETAALLTVQGKG